MNTKRRRTLWRILVAILLFIFLCFVYGFQDEVKVAVRAILDSRWTATLATIYCGVAVVMHRVFIKEQSVMSMALNFKIHTDFILQLATYLLGISTAIALVKGFLMQVVFDEIYFIGFDKLDIASICLVSSFLLFYFLNGATELFIDVFFQADAKSVTKTDES